MTFKNGTGLMLVADPLRVINLVPDFSADDLLEHPLLMCLEFFNKFLQETRVSCFLPHSYNTMGFTNIPP